MPALMAIAMMLMPPPPPPPDPDRLAEAVLIWRDHPLPERSLPQYAQLAIGEVVPNILDGARVRRAGRQWLPKYRLLQDYFWTHIAADVQANERPFLECLAQRYAWMSIEEIRTTRQFLSTPAGERFWNAGGLSERDGPQCAWAVFGDDLGRVQDGAWTLIGARRPPPPPPVD